jgi:hypothetical protein
LLLVALSVLPRRHRDDSTAYGATRYAAERLLPNCKETEYRFHAYWNGVDRESGQGTNGCY